MNTTNGTDGIESTRVVLFEIFPLIQTLYNLETETLLSWPLLCFFVIPLCKFVTILQYFSLNSYLIFGLVHNTINHFHLLELYRISTKISSKTKRCGKLAIQTNSTVPRLEFCFCSKGEWNGLRKKNAFTVQYCSRSRPTPATTDRGQWLTRSMID